MHGKRRHALTNRNCGQVPFGMILTDEEMAILFGPKGAMNNQMAPEITIETDGADAALQALGIKFAVDTGIVVTSALPLQSGIIVINSAKFAHYATGNIVSISIDGDIEISETCALPGRS